MTINNSQITNHSFLCYLVLVNSEDSHTSFRLFSIMIIVCMYLPAWIVFSISAAYYTLDRGLVLEDQLI